MRYLHKSFTNPQKFCRSFKDIYGNPTNIYEQKDATEFINLLFERLEASIDALKKPNFIKDCFGGSFDNEVTCLECNTQYRKQDPFLTINLSVKNMKNINESLLSLLEEQHLTGENAYFCEKCNKKVNARKKVVFNEIPDNLVLILNRFEYSVDHNTRTKLNDYFEFYHTLNSQNFDPEKIPTSSIPINLKMINNNKRRDFEYVLQGVVVHVGNAHSGHYFSLIREDLKSSNHKDERWFEYNDVTIKDFDPADLPDIAFGGDGYF